MLTSRPRGTNDILPGQIEKWHYLEKVACQVCAQYGYHEIRTPIFEHTELFLRGVGETTDIVEKEMYSFFDKKERNITLRPEGTAPTVRAFLENKLYADPQPTKLFYIGPMFRYDKPQAGRYRQFSQFGIEAFGSHHPSIDAEVITLALDFFHRLGLNDLELHINTVGCPACRPIYREKLIAYFESHLANLCSSCQKRLFKNPLRILDCKNPACQKASESAPTSIEFACDDCLDHYYRVKEYLNAVDIKYLENPRLVRGLDYYTHTAFEILVQGIGAQSAICGGGRYNGLIEECGGEALPGIGFAIGLERLLLVLEQDKLINLKLAKPEIYISSLGEKAQLVAFQLAINLRQKGFRVEMDYLQRSLKAQLKSADRLQTKYAVIIGEDELKNGKLLVREMQTGEQIKVLINNLEGYLERGLRK